MVRIGHVEIILVALGLVPRCLVPYQAEKGRIFSQGCMARRMRSGSALVSLHIKDVLWPDFLRISKELASPVVQW